MPDPAVSDPAVSDPAVSGPAALEPAIHGPPVSAARLVLAFDFGHRRIGVACGDTLSRTAAPLTAVPASGGVPRFELIDALLRDWQPALLVVGLPYNVDGTESGMTRDARGFAAALTRRYALEVQMTDERYSSTEAAGRLKAARESGLRRRRVDKADVDAAAACVILERWFSEEKTSAHAFATR
jgi:putative Holliday junction resolvase